MVGLHELMLDNNTDLQNEHREPIKARKVLLHSDQVYPGNE